MREKNNIKFVTCISIVVLLAMRAKKRKKAMESMQRKQALEVEAIKYLGRICGEPYVAIATSDTDKKNPIVFALSETGQNAVKVQYINNRWVVLSSFSGY